MMRSSQRNVTALLLLLMTCLASCGVNRPALHKTTRLLMGTFVEVTVAGKRQVAREAANAAIAEMGRVEKLTSFHTPGSVVSKINAAAGTQTVSTGNEVLGLIQRSLGFAQATDGAFDPTIGPLSSLWGFSAGEPRLPSADQIRDRLGKTGWKRVQIQDQPPTVFLPEKGMALDLGAIAKGHALDRGAQVLRSRGVSGGLINAGGDVVAVGQKGAKSPWKVGVRDPRTMNAIVAVIELRDRAVVTSGDYERTFEHDGKRYHHILDPRTGYPARLAQSVTVVAPNATIADALATAVFVLGPGKGLALVEETDDVEALIMDHSGNLHLSTGAKRLFDVPGTRRETDGVPSGQ